MKAVTITKYGNPEVLEIVDLNKPKIKQGEILVKVMASSVNPVDWKVRKGMLRFLPGQKLPKQLGGDIAGIVEEIGKDVSEFKPGDEIYGLIPAIHGGGYAEYAVAKQYQIVHKPKELSFYAAAAIPLAALTAFQSLKDLGGIKKGSKVLVNGCSGGVGHFAVQLAKALQANVTGVCSTKNIEFAKTLGADKLIDYTCQNALDDCKYDIVFDAVASMNYFKVMQALKKRGIYVTTLPLVSAIIGSLVNFLTLKKCKIIRVRSKSDDLRFLSELIKSGKLTVNIEKTYKLNEIREAHRRSETGRVVGKLAIHIGDKS